jgi:hypothetical protein
MYEYNPLRQIGRQGFFLFQIINWQNSLNMSLFAIPHNLSLPTEAHHKWMKMLKDAQDLVDYDVDLQV